jgi:hypothetical protein
MWRNGNMYLGEWKRKVLSSYSVRHGFGAYYRHGPEAYKGWVYIGEIKDGKERPTASASSFGSNQHQAGRKIDLLAHLLTRMALVVRTCTVEDV